ncbi:MAG: RsiV family protein [Spirochaetaceae bacterium]|jgi:hypothetical protein|nr:RsiV family protein [Spirochaetaceae bacterium]
MKTKSVIRKPGTAVLALAGILLLGVFSGACQSVPDGSSGETRRSETEFETAAVKNTVRTAFLPLNPDSGNEGPRLFISMAVQNIPVEGKLGELVRDALFGGFDPETYAEQVIAGYRARYQDAGQTAAAAEDGAPSESWNWEYRETIEGAETGLERAPAGLTRCLTVSRVRDYYQGGAHGMREKRYFLFDTAAMRRLALEDIIPTAAYTALGRLLAAKLRDFAGIPEDASLRQGGFFTEHPEIPENFFLTPAGLGFHWDPYEIAPYVMGFIEIVIPYDEIAPLLR